MAGLQDYIISVDQMELHRRLPNYGERYTQKLLEIVSRNNGVIYVAEHEGRVIGCIAGIVYESSQEQLLGYIPSKTGRVEELFVESAYRGQGVGTMLTEKMERYFTQNGCDVARVEVFEPNIEAHHFYQELGYHNDTIDMIKKL